MFSVSLSPKAITLIGFHCNKNEDKTRHILRYEYNFFFLELKFTEIFHPVIGDRSVCIVDCVARAKEDGLAVELYRGSELFVLEQLVRIGLQLFSLLHSFAAGRGLVWGVILEKV